MGFLGGRKRNERELWPPEGGHALVEKLDGNFFESVVARWHGFKNHVGRALRTWAIEFLLCVAAIPIQEMGCHGEGGRAFGDDLLFNSFSRHISICQTYNQE